MATVPLLGSRLLATAAFVRDLTAFLSLSAEMIIGISEAVEDPEGFVGQGQAEHLNARLGISTNEAVRRLRVAKYLYDRVTELAYHPTRGLPIEPAGTQAN